MVGFSVLNVIIFLTILNLKSNPVSLILIRCHFSMACITEELLDSTPLHFSFSICSGRASHMHNFFNFAIPFFIEIIFAVSSFCSFPIQTTGLT